MVYGFRQISTENVVIVRNIWQKLSSVERKVTLIVTNIWQNLNCLHKIRNNTVF
jgi:hypothetical protein